MAWFHRDGPYCMSNATYDTRNMNPGLIFYSTEQIPCTKSLYSAGYNCTNVLDYSLSSTTFRFDQNFTTSIISTPQGPCFQLDGIPNPSCNATSIIVACQDPAWPQPECLLLSQDTGKCLVGDDTPLEAGPWVRITSGCVYANGQSFNCQRYLSPPCRLPNGSVSPHNCSTICSTPKLLFESVASFTYCAAQAVGNLMPVDSFITDDALESILPHTNACMEEYCATPAAELGGPCPYVNHTSMQDFIYDCSRNVTVRIDADVGGVGVSIAED
jgi:hypothetical protein